MRPITIYTQAEDDALVRWAKRQPEVVDAQMRAWRSIKVVTDSRV